ncbi:MAG TPA: helix-turn-helix domain-containing protein [Streptosporangiaceae bacterium]
MRLVENLLGHPGLDDLVVLAGDPAQRAMRSVELVDDLSALGQVAADSVVVMTARACAEAADYAFDLALRKAASAQAACILLTGDSQFRLHPTARRIAERAGTVLLWRPAGAGPAATVLAVAATLSDGADLELERIRSGLASIERAAAQIPADAGRVVAAAARALGTPVEQVGADADIGQDEGAVPIYIDGEASGALRIGAGADQRDTAGHTVVRLAAYAIGQALSRDRRAELAPLRSRATILGDLLTDPGQHVGTLLASARSLGLHVDGWHSAIRIEIEPEVTVDEVRRFELLDAAGHVARDAASSDDPSWQQALHQQGVVLVSMRRREHSPHDLRQTTRLAQRLVSQLSAALPGVRVRAGVGTAQLGLAGMRASVAEARSAIMSAAAAGRPDPVAAFDAVGVRRMLLEWYASDSVRESAAELLAPIDALGPRQALESIRTLLTYIEEQGSVSRIAARLSLHRNGAAYRVRQLQQMLGTALDDPDYRLALQLACKARLL